MTSLREKKRVYYDHMTVAELNFQQCSFLWKSHILPIFWLRKHPFILGLTFRYKIPRTMRVLSEMEYISIIPNGGSKMADADKSFL